MGNNRWNSDGLAPCTANHAPLTPVAFLDRAERVFGDREAVVYGVERQTWAQFARTCRQFASALSRANLQPGDVVAVMMFNTPPMVAAHFAVPMAGAVLNTVNTRLDADSVAYILGHSQARMLIVDAELFAVASAALAQMAAPPRLVVAADPSAGVALPAQVEGFQTFLDGGDGDAAPLAVTHEWSPVAVNYTSGTTGRPKGVVYSHRGAYLAAVSTVVSWGVPKGASYLWTLPLFHCNGWGMPWVLALQGGKNVCLRRVDGATIVRLIAEESVTHYCGAPIVHALIRDEAERQARVFAPNVAAMIGGAPPSPSLLRSMEAIGVRLTHCYGLTETYGPAAICETQPAWAQLGETERAVLSARQGLPCALQADMAVLRTDRAERVPADGVTVGEIAFQGNITMMGYLDDPAATEQVFAEGWFRSGDLAVLEADGYVRIKDRSKDIIISGGENISSVEIENVLYAHPLVAAVAVVAQFDERWGEVPVAFVELREGSVVTGAELIALCRQHLAHFKCPKRVLFQSLPKTATGKIQKNLVREQLRARA
ncbi:MAG: AMP-binding protein [Pseudomonadota bacterium]